MLKYIPEVSNTELNTHSKVLNQNNYYLTPLNKIISFIFHHLVQFVGEKASSLCNSQRHSVVNNNHLSKTLKNGYGQRQSAIVLLFMSDSRIQPGKIFMSMRELFFAHVPAHGLKYFNIFLM